ncbi:MAG: pyrimidine 5'-nucleotidase, partial [Parvibaculum sp.]|nr:pyrimidine 5'-nucleotidase [Parvibaculum sp.]
MTPPDMPLSPPSRGFGHVETWVFDLDNTLYPPACDLFAQVDQRMTAFIGDYLKIDALEARRIQKDFYVEHGTTLSGLMAVYGLEPA